MPRTSSLVLAGVLAASLVAMGPGLADGDGTERELDRYRAMMKADPWSNPANLDADRGEALWRTRRGPRDATLEACDLGLGPGRVDGAFAALPRYFPDAGRVMDAEARLVWCMEKLQGIPPRESAAPWPASGQPATDLGALATFVAARSAGMRFAVPTAHAREKEALALGEALFFRRMGPMDFACATCHAEEGRRIRRQELPVLSKREAARKVVGEWPAYRVSSAHVMTMQHRIYDCFWQMRLPRIDPGSEVAVALVMYLATTAEGGEIRAPGIKR